MCEKAATIARPTNNRPDQDTMPYFDPQQVASVTDAFSTGPPMTQIPTPETSLPLEHEDSMITPTSPVQQILTQAMGQHLDLIPAPSNMNFEMPYNLDSFGGSDATMGDFLIGVMNPAPSDTFANVDTMLPDVLDFTFDDFMEFPLSNFERGAYLSQPVASTIPSAHRDISRSHEASGTLTPNVRKAADIGLQAFKESMWSFTPGQDDRHTADQIYLTLPPHAATSGNLPESPSSWQLSLEARDRMLALILRLCERDVQRHIVARFPTSELLSAMAENFLAYHSRQVLSWVHLPTLDLEEIREELLLSIVSWGAAHSRHPDIRKLGFAMQETARFAVAEMFEEDNRTIRDLRAMQTNGLHLHVGLWSGIRRKIEISESFMMPFVTMLRRGGRFREKTQCAPDHSEDPTANENRWRQWMEAESMKRLSFHALYEDTCISMALFNPPLVNPLEFHLELPCSRRLWDAASADEWRQVLLTTPASSDMRLPMFRACIGDVGTLINNQSSVDMQMSFMLLVCSVWSRVWQWRQMKAFSTIANHNANSLPVSSYKQEIESLLKQLALSEADILGGIGPHPKLLLEICQMHLHVSLEDIQIFAGKEGQEEARKMMASLRAWTKLSDSRQAIFHAGQILRQASHYPFGFLSTFAAVAVYHASLVLWAYAVLAEPEPGQATRFDSSPASNSTEFVRLDGSQSPGDYQRFLMLGKGMACIRAYKIQQDQDDGVITPLTDPMGIMESITNLLAHKNGTFSEMPPIVSNLVKLMQSLGKAASILKRRKS
jgi:hypothetical protein